MAAPKFSAFELLLMRSNNELGTSVLMLLCWIASSDGRIDDAEVSRIRTISEASKHDDEIETIFRLAVERDLDSLQLAAEIVSRHFKGEKAPLFMQMAIGMAIADGFLLPAENYILRFIADLLSLDPDELSAVFGEVTGRAIPDPSDPSTAEWWRARDDARGREQQQSRSGKRSHSGRRSIGRIGALAVLGLDETASIHEIRTAYRRLAQIHHPDRFASLGKESVAAATSTFQRIKEAYDYLSSNA